MSPTPKKRVIALISGRGSNLLALLAAMSEKHYQIELVISDQEAVGLQHAQRFGVATQSIMRAEFETRAQHREAIFSAVREAKPDLVVLAGFMMIIPKTYTDEFAGKLINIHPSLLPKFPGLDVHQRVLSAQESTHGCTVHFVDDGMDTGPIIAQAQCQVLRDDTPETLAARVLPLEHQLYPWVVDQICSGDISLKERAVTYSAAALNQARILGFMPGIEKNHS